MPCRNRALAAFAIWITGTTESGCQANAVRPAGEIRVSVVRGLMGDGDAICALDPSRHFLDVSLIADCPTTSPLVLTVRNADPFDSSFQPVREERPETLTANSVRRFRTNRPLTLTPHVKELRLTVEAKCIEGDAVHMRYGDARCEVPPAPRRP